MTMTPAEVRAVTISDAELADELERIAKTVPHADSLLLVETAFRLRKNLRGDR